VSAADEDAGRARRSDLALFLLAAALVVRLWVMPLTSSLWLDEFGTTWITSGPMAEIVERARLFPQSIPYAALIRVVRSITGSSEPSLRWPSLVAMLGAAVVIGRLGRRLFGAPAGVAAAVIFLLFPQVEFSAGDARPYAFGVLAVAAALLFLVRWLDGGAARDGILYVFCAALSVYFQYLFATSLVAHAVYAGRRRANSSVSPRAMALAAAGLAVLLAPAAGLVVEIGRRWPSHAFGVPPGALNLLTELVPVRVLGLLVPALLLAAVFGAARAISRTRLDGRDRDALALLGTLALFPPLALFAVALRTGTSLLEGRYLLATAAAWAVLLGALVARLRPARAAHVVLTLALALALVTRGELARWKIDHGREDWRSAVAALDAANGNHPVFLAGTFVESGDPSLVRDPLQEDYLLAPLAYYRTRGRSRVLPLRSGPAADVEGERRIARALTGDRLGLIERSSRFPSWGSWLAARLAPLGYSEREVWSTQTLRASVFVRSP
jgi:mannosyltransferase